MMTELSLGKIQQMKHQGMSNNQIIAQLQQEGHSSSEIFDVLSQVDQPRSESAPSPPMYQPPPMPQADNEEMIEAIIDEKWNDLMSDINKVIAWKESTESRISKMEQHIADLGSQFDKLHQAIIGKVGEYDQHILDVGAEVRAMEKVFSKVLPIFTDNVAELSRVADEFKGQTKRKK